MSTAADEVRETILASRFVKLAAADPRDGLPPIEVLKESLDGVHSYLIDGEQLLTSIFKRVCAVTNFDGAQHVGYDQIGVLLTGSEQTLAVLTGMTETVGRLVKSSAVDLAAITTAGHMPWYAHFDLDGNEAK